MTEPHRTKTRIKVGPALESLMDAQVGQPPMELPKTKADFDRLVAQAESDLTPAPRGRPAKGKSRAATLTRSIRAPVELWERLEHLARAKGVSVNQATVLALESLVTG